MLNSAGIPSSGNFTILKENDGDEDLDNSNHDETEIVLPVSFLRQSLISTHPVEGSLDAYSQSAACTSSGRASETVRKPETKDESERKLWIEQESTH